MSTGVIAFLDAGSQTTAIQRLIEDHLGLVEQIARHFFRRHQGRGLVDLNDLVQEGMLGLMYAAQRFDATRGYQFNTYAGWWISKMVLQAIASQTQLIRLPENVWIELQGLSKAQSLFWQEHQREPWPEELALLLQCEKERVVFLLQAQQEVLSLESPLPFTANAREEEGQHLGDLLEAPDTSTHGEQSATVTDMLKYLTPQEQRVVMCRYQFGTGAEYGVEDIPLPYSEVARRLGMTRKLVAAIEDRAFAKLRFWAERGHLFNEKP